MRLNLVLLGLVVAEEPNPKTDALAAKGPAAIAEALEAECPSQRFALLLTARKKKEVDTNST